MFDVVIADGVIVSGHNGYQPFRGSIGITGSRIAFVGKQKLTRNDGHSFIDASPKIVMAGLVNGHCHGELAFAKGIGDAMTLQEQMQQFGEVGWFFDQLTDEERYASRQLTYCEALLSGTTLLVENMFRSLGKQSQAAIQEIGLRGALAEDIRGDFSLSDSFLSAGALADFKEHCLQNEQIPLLGTLPEEEFTDARLCSTKRIIDASGCGFTSHLSETTWRHKAALAKMGASPVEVLERYGLLNEHYIGSHAVYLSSSDIALLQKRGVKVVSTPVCELKIADGVAPIPQMLAAGIPVALGTDGAMWNNANDIFREMRCMAMLHNLKGGVCAISPREVLEMATVNGAKLFGLQNELGTLEQGKLADIITVDTRKPHMQPLRLGPLENVVSNLVYCACGNDVCDVFVGGRPRVLGHQLQEVNLDAILQTVDQTSRRIFG